MVRVRVPPSSGKFHSSVGEHVRNTHSCVTVILIGVALPAVTVIVALGTWVEVLLALALIVK
jgi:hypothetical protein